MKLKGLELICIIDLLEQIPVVFVITCHEINQVAKL